MSIHFKFKSAKEFDTVTFPGAVIRVLDLKKAIVDKKKLAKGLDFDLVITDAQNGKVYDDENMQLPRNTSVTVKRIPSATQGQGLLARMKSEAAQAAAQAATAAVQAQLRTSPVMPLASAGTQHIPAAPLTVVTTTTAQATGASGGAQTMEDELAALQSIHEQAEDMRGARPLGNKTWSASTGSNADKVVNYYGPPGGAGAGRGFHGGRGGGRGEFGAMGGRGGRGGGPVGPMGGAGVAGGAGGPMGQHPGGIMGKPPPNYVCYRCGTPGHYIQNCPTNGDPEYDQHRVKKKTGIPKSFMKPVSDPSEIPVGAGKTVVNAPWGGLAVIEPQNKNFSKLMAKSGGSATLDQLISNPPDHLACPLCKRLMNDAVLIQCCQESACDECLRSALIDNKLTCPLCATPNMSPEKLLTNKVLRTSIEEFLRRARTEQQEREQLVKDAEEKALAKQKAAEASSRRTGDSADATLEIKKNGKKDQDAEEDEFGGDIFGSGDEDETPGEKVSSAQSSPAQPPAGGAHPPLPPLPPPTEDAGVIQVSTEGSAVDGVDDKQTANPGELGSDGQTSHHPPGFLGAGGPWNGMVPPPGGQFGPPGPWFDGPRPPGPWFDGPPPPWFNGPFPPGGRGGPSGGGRGGRGGARPPPGYFGPPPGHPDYFGPPPGHPDYFGPPGPWFDGPTPPFGGGRGGWGERGPPQRGAERDNGRRPRSQSKDLTKDEGREGGDKSTDGKARDTERRAGGARSNSRPRDRDRDRDRDRKRGSRSRSRSRGRHERRSSSRKARSDRSRSRSRSRGHKRHDRESQGKESSSRRDRSRSASRRRDEKKSLSKPAEGADGASGEANTPRDEEDKNESETVVKSKAQDVKVEEVAAPAIDLDFLEEDVDMASDTEKQHSNETSTDDKKERGEDGNYAKKALSTWKNEAANAAKNGESSPSSRRRSSERGSSRDRRSGGRESGRSRRSRSRSHSRGRRSSESKRRGEPSSSTTREKERDRDRGRDRDRRDRDRRGRDRGRDRRDKDSKRGRDDGGDRSGDRDRKKRRSDDEDGAETPTKGSGRTVTSTSSRSKQSGGRSGGSRNEKRKIEFDDDSERKRSGSGYNKESRGGKSSSSSSFGDHHQAKKRSVLDRLGPAV